MIWKRDSRCRWNIEARAADAHSIVAEQGALKNSQFSVSITWSNGWGSVLAFRHFRTHLNPSNVPVSAASTRQLLPVRQIRLPHFQAGRPSSRVTSRARVNK